MKSLWPWKTAALLALCFAWCGCQPPTSSRPVNAANKPASEEKTSLQVFEQRILPILQADKPSSCAECHLSGVDLKDYIRADQAQTFAALVERQLIDVKNPEQSKLLTFIARAPEKPSLVSETVRKEELEAFRQWIMVAVKDPSLLAAKASEPVGPQVPDEVIRHARNDRVLESFVENVWAEAGRCAACHSPDRNQEQVTKHGERVSWMQLRDPEATLRYMLNEGLIDTENPEKSLIILKPTMQIDHGGGQKMVIGDRTHKQFRKFVDDYKASLDGKYKSADELPKPNDEVVAVSEIWFKVTDIPAKYDQMLLQVDIYPWQDGAWSPDRVATSDRSIFGKGGLWQHNLSLVAKRNSATANEIEKGKLPPGRYKVKILLDQTGKLSKDFKSELTDSDLVGEVEFESQWPEGYGSMTVVKFPE
jgi:mono/diheme cytochrome c family protein